MISNCPKCDATLDATSEFCPSCRKHVGFPNVRIAGATDERRALTGRERESRRNARKASCVREYKTFGRLLRRSCVVVSFPARFALQLVNDPTALYPNYEKLVNAGVRGGASPENESRRTAVDAFFFGRAGREIRYGVLAIGFDGVPTYGGMFLLLRDITIKKRVSFLERNSFRFAEEHALRLIDVDKIPRGSRAVWGNRHLLGLVKIGHLLRPGQNRSIWRKLLVSSDRVNRRNDEFVEAHIYGGFSIDAIADMKRARGVAWTKPEKIDAEIAIERFRQRQNRT